MNIAGIGIVFSRGRGVIALEQALEQGWVAPGDVETPGLPSGRLPVYAVPPGVLVDGTVLAKARRADRFARMCVLAASDALQDSGLAASVDKTRMGVIVATALGAHTTTFGFLDGILDFGDAVVSPTAFSHSLHNAAASYIAMTLDVRGPTLTVTHFHFAFHQAVLLAGSWLTDGSCDAVLVGAADELGSVMHYVCGRMLQPSVDGRIKPFAFSATAEVVPGEGSAFFLLTREAAGAGYARVAEVVQNRLPPAWLGATVQVIDAGGIATDESAYREVGKPGMRLAAYAPIFGSLMTGSAFNVAAAALMLKRQKIFACPVLDNPHGVTICSDTVPAALDDISCTRLDCRGGMATLHLAR